VKNKTTSFLCAVVAIILFTLTFLTVTNPLRESESDIQLWLQETTPLGTLYSEVLQMIKVKGWYDENLQGSDGNTPDIYLRGYIGRYWSIPFFTYVDVFWEFDHNNKLQNIRVWKTTDGI
jgi:hypothetical protein